MQLLSKHCMKTTVCGWLKPLRCALLPQELCFRSLRFASIQMHATYWVHQACADLAVKHALSGLVATDWPREASSCLRNIPMQTLLAAWQQTYNTLSNHMLWPHGWNSGRALHYQQEHTVSPFVVAHLPVLICLMVTANLAD